MKFNILRSAFLALHLLMLGMGSSVPGYASATVSISRASGNVPEGLDDLIVVARSGETNSPLTVYFTVEGTADTADYRLFTRVGDEQTPIIANQLTVPAGAYSQLLIVASVEDRAVESSETVIINLSSNAAYTVGDDHTATDLITDDDYVVTVTADPPNAAEQGRAGSQFTLTRAGNTDNPLEVHFAIGGSAAVGRDYRSSEPLLTGRLFLLFGESSKSVPIDILDDALVEGAETLVLTLITNSAYMIGTNDSATITITDNDLEPPAALPIVTIVADAPNTWREPYDLGPTTFTISRTGDTNSDLPIQLRWSGTAIYATDYAPLLRDAVIAAGNFSATLAMEVIDDPWAEDLETVVLMLPPSEGYSVGSPDTATATIQDNDDFPTVYIAVTDPNASESGADSATFTLTRRGALDAPLTIKFRFFSSTASDGVDYFGWSGPLSGTASNYTDHIDVHTLYSSVTIPAGQTTTTITLTPVDDGEAEGTDIIRVWIDPYTHNYWLYDLDPQQFDVSFADNDDLPAVHWRDQDIGLVGSQGIFVYTQGRFTIRGSGSDIGGNADAFHYAWRDWTGDGVFVARVDHIDNTDLFARGGLMIRETLDPGSRHASMLFRAGGHAVFQARGNAGTNVWTDGTSDSLPYWVKLVRRGSTVLGFESKDGSAWILVDSVTLDLPTAVLVGLAVTSRNNAALCEATFRHVSLSAVEPPLSPVLANFGFTSDGAAMSIYGQTNRSYRIDTSSNLIHWTPMATQTITRVPSRYVDRTSTNYPTRFYRLISP